MEIIITRGLPASGKSTWAKSQVGYKRVNRDDLRKMIDNGKWSKKNENLIKSIELHAVKNFLVEGHNVIIDNTHLSDKTIRRWEEFAKQKGVKLTIKDFTHVPIDECIKRDQNRPNYVGEKVIRRMYNDFLYKNPVSPDVSLSNTLPKCWIFDLDGTLALHTSGRSPYEEQRCEEDSVNESVRAIFNSIRVPRNIFIVSGRSENVRDITERWLRTNELEYTDLYMRGKEDKRNDSIIKREIYMDKIYGRYTVMGWFDDRLRVCREIHNLGLPLFRVGDPDADF